MNKVSVYSSLGWLEDLPDLLQGRDSHGCGHYVNDGNKMVIFHTIRKYLCLIHYQVYLVTGGWSGSSNLVPTEVLIDGENTWRKVGDLPTVPINGLQGVSINNNIIMTGNEYLVQFIQFYFISQVDRMAAPMIITTTFWPSTAVKKTGLRLEP